VVWSCSSSSAPPTQVRSTEQRKLLLLTLFGSRRPVGQSAPARRRSSETNAAMVTAYREHLRQHPELIDAARAELELVLEHIDQLHAKRRRGDVHAVTVGLDADASGPPGPLGPVITGVSPYGADRACQRRAVHAWSGAAVRRLGSEPRG
jgi:hypothetical protein